MQDMELMKKLYEKLSTTRTILLSVIIEFCYSICKVNCFIMCARKKGKGYSN